MVIQKSGVYYLEFLVYNFGQSASLEISFLKRLKGILFVFTSPSIASKYLSKE